MEVLHAPVVDELPGNPSLRRPVKVDADQQQEGHGQVERSQRAPALNMLQFRVHTKSFWPVECFV